MSFGFKYGLPLDADLVVDMRFLPNPYWVPELRPHHRAGRRRSADYVLAPGGRRRVPRRVRRPARAGRRGLPARGQALRHRRGRLHRRQAPPRGDGRGARRAGCATDRRRRPPSCTATWGGSEPARGASAVRSSRSAAATAWPPSLAALRLRHRPTSPRSSRSPTTAAPAAGCASEFGVLPPGDLRMALAALCGDDEWGQHLARRAAAPLRRRPAPLGGHAARQPADRRAVGAARRPGRRAGPGRPAARRPRPGAADGRRAARASRPRSRGARPRATRTRSRRSAARSQVAVDAGPGARRCAWSRPTRRPAPRRWPRSRERRLGRARARAPGSPRVMPHLLRARAARGARRQPRPGGCSTLNLGPHRARPPASRRSTTSRCSPRYAPDLRLDVGAGRPERRSTTSRRWRACAPALGAELVARAGGRRATGPPRHDPLRLRGCAARTMLADRHAADRRGTLDDGVAG